jgi:hypothetical protein
MVAMDTVTGATVATDTATETATEATVATDTATETATEATVNKKINQLLLVLFEIN